MGQEQGAASRGGEPESDRAKGKSHPFWRAFWLAFLVVSLGYAWYSFYAPSNEIAWSESFAVAQEEAQESRRPILLFFTGQWCSPCQIMKRQVWADDRVRDVVNEGFVPVLIDVDDAGTTEVVTRYGVGSTPTTIVTDSTGAVLRAVRGRVARSDLLQLLRHLN